MKKLSLIFTVITAAALFLTACASEAAPAEAVPQEAQPVGWIAEGRLMPATSLDQSFSIPGQVAEVLVEDGESVSAGQAIARLENSPEAQAAFARAQQEYMAAQQALDDLKASSAVSLAEGKLALITAQEKMDEAQDVYDSDDTYENQVLLEKATAEFSVAEETLKKLETGDGIRPELLEAAQSRVTSASTALASAQAVLDALELKSTLAGTIVDLNLQPGEKVTAGAPVVTVADFSSWVVKTDNLTEAEVVNLQVGQTATITLDALPDQPLQGEVTRINARYEEKRGDITYTVTVALKDTLPQMRWGMTAAVEFLP